METKEIISWMIVGTIGLGVAIAVMLNKEIPLYYLLVPAVPFGAYFGYKYLWKGAKLFGDTSLEKAKMDEMVKAIKTNFLNKHHEEIKVLSNPYPVPFWYETTEKAEPWCRITTIRKEGNIQQFLVPLNTEEILAGTMVSVPFEKYPTREFPSKQKLLRIVPQKPKRTFAEMLEEVDPDLLRGLLRAEAESKRIEQPLLPQIQPTTQPPPEEVPRRRFWGGERRPATEEGAG